MTEYKLIPTEDGSNTVLSSGFGETYHSVKGALSESLHVFIETGLKYILSRCEAIPEGEFINILEIGFGTGLNALLALKETLKNRINVRYVSYEKYPMPKDVLLNLFPEKDDAFEWIHDIPWDSPSVFNGIGAFFELHKCNADFVTAKFPDNEYHIVFIDRKSVM